MKINITIKQRDTLVFAIRRLINQQNDTTDHTALLNILRVAE